MLSVKTLLELIKVADKFSHPEINRLVSVFNFSPLMRSSTNTVTAKTTSIFNEMRYSPNKPGPFSSDIQMDFLQYLIDYFFEKNPKYERGLAEYDPYGPVITLSNAFAITHKQLANCLKRDGYIVVGREVKKLLPQEIEEAKTDSELMAGLDKYSFQTSKGHLTQAIANHSQGNWAGANSQFRTFIESLLTEISGSLVPANKAQTGAQAIKILSETVNPPFLTKDLNEIPADKDSDSFVYGLWVRLHPNGSHPGLSDEDDCSFRYHISIVFANYLLRRLDDRKKAK